MNRKRARKIAEKKLPQLEEVQLMRKRLEYLAGCDVLLRAMVRKAGGEFRLSADDLKNVPNVKPSFPQAGGIVLKMVTPEPRGLPRSPDDPGHPLHSTTTASDLPREGETEDAWRARTGHPAKAVETEPAAIEVPQHPCQGCRWLQVGIPGGMTCRHGSRSSYDCDPNCDLKELPAVAPVAIPDHRRPNNDQRSDCPECGAEWEQGKGCVNIDCPNCLPAVPPDQIAMTPKATETEGA